jgi:AAA15 family ATPase/GTPase
MSELLLDSLEIKGYRCFEHLTIEKLGRVNLIVGKNNVGKTALLEALWIFSQKYFQSQFYEILTSRNEITKVKSDVLEDEHLWGLRHLFTNRPQLFNWTDNAEFTIGILNRKEDTLEVILNFPTQSFSHPRADVQGFSLRVVSEFIKLNGLETNYLSRLWDEITLTESEDLVLVFLKLITQDVKKLNFIGYPKGAQNRIPVVQTEASIEPVPLKSLGEGMNRLLGVTLALVNCEDGILLIDEIESGLHYSVLPDVWKLIFKTAKDLNVQVFATTHSKDCIEAFTQAAIDDEESKGMLIRLERNKDDKIIAKTIEEERLADAINYGAEVR